MELHQLRYFLAVVREGTFTRAADRLYITQPSLSEQIRKLEGELGTPLFERLGRSLALTNAGEAFLPHAERVLLEVEEARRRVQEVQGLSRGRVTLGSLPSPAAQLLPRVLAEFRNVHPGVRVRVREEDVSAAIEDGVRGGEIDLGVVRLPGQHPELEAQLLLEDPLMLVVPVSHPLARQRSLPLQAAADQPFVAMRSGHGLRELLDVACRRAGFEPAVVADAGRLSTLLGLVTVGVGVTVLPRMAAFAGRRIPLQDPQAHRLLGLVWRRGEVVAPAARALREILLASVSRAGIGP